MSTRESCPDFFTGLLEGILLHKEVRPLEWNLSLVLRSMTHMSYWPLKLSIDKHLTWKTCFLLAIVLAKQVNKLHNLSL